MDVDNRLTLQKLEIFCRVVELDGVGRAAEDLFLSQPVVSSHLKSLQSRIGIELFQRDGRGLRLTEAGQEVYRWAIGVLRGRMELARSLEGLEQGMAGSAIIGANMATGNTLLAEPLIEFRKEHPDARIACVVSTVEAALERVRSGRLDFAVVSTELAHDSRVFETELVGRPRFAVAVSAENRELPSRLEPADLTRLAWVTPPSGMAIRRSQDAALASIGVLERDVAIEMGTAELILTAVEHGLGACLAWRVAIEEKVRAGTLREIEIVGGEQLRDNLYLVRRHDFRPTRLQARLKDHILERIGARLLVS